MNHDVQQPVGRKIHGVVEHMGRKVHVAGDPLDDSLGRPRI